ncbi:MAG: type II toxin-antitoxin system RelE/ParE family toxin [Polaromonas sp.]|nr:type II toxin-antitoxin system RelE/ParE family toxin [Polaromonas sp.]
MLRVRRLPGYIDDLDGIAEYIAQDNSQAAYDMWQLIDDQVEKLADPNFPRRRGRRAGTLELVAHPNYVVVLEQTATTVTAMAVMHVARQYP